MLYRYLRILQLSLIQLCVTTPRASRTSSPTSVISCYHAALVALSLSLTNLPGPICLSRNVRLPLSCACTSIASCNRLAPSLAGKTTKSNMRSRSLLPAPQPPPHGSHCLFDHSGHPPPYKTRYLYPPTVYPKYVSKQPLTHLTVSCSAT